MNSPIFKSIGIGNLDAAYIFFFLLLLIIILAVLIIMQQKKITKLNKSYLKFMAGKNAASLEEEIGTIFHDIKSLKNTGNKNTADINKIQKNLMICYQKVGIVRYDAFREMGGKLSFSIALLDKNNNGFLLNSVHSTTGCYTYTKEIQDGKCYIDLGDEEQEALKKAMSSEAEQEKSITDNQNA